MRKARGLSPLVGFAFGMLAAVAIAGPASVNLLSGIDEVIAEADDPTLKCEVDVVATEGSELVEGTDESEITLADEPSDESATCDNETDEEEESDAAEGREEREGDNHGAAVSTAAHCQIRGFEHGKLVREIAHDKDATVADAEAACEAALEALEDAGSGERRHGRPPPWAGKGRPSSAGGGKPPWAGGGGGPKDH